MVTKLKPLRVGFHLFKDGKGISLRMLVLPSKILTLIVTAPLNSPLNESSSVPDSGLDDSASLYVDDNDCTVYVCNGNNPDDNNLVYADIDKTPKPTQRREKVLVYVEKRTKMAWSFLKNLTSQSSKRSPISKTQSRLRLC